MKLVVCIKQVPSNNNAKIDPETGTIIRSNISSKMNPFDLFALEAALQIKEQTASSVDVITMGPPNAIEVVKEAIAIGADNGYIISDMAFAGADVLATSYTLSQAIKLIGDYNVVFCGQQTTDGDTAQVGAGIAEFLGIDHACNVSKILSYHDKSFDIEVDLGDCIMQQSIVAPCLMTIQRDSNTPRLPSYKRKCKYANKDYSILSLDNMLDTNAKNYGFDGSPTNVEKIFPPEITSENISIHGSAQQKAKTIVNSLKDMKLL